MFFDLDKEKRMAEMMGMGQVTQLFKPSDGKAIVPRGFDTSKANFH